MMPFLRLGILAAIAYWLYKTLSGWQPDNIATDYREREDNIERGNLKADVRMRHEVPVMAIGETPYSGVSFSPLTPGPHQDIKPLRLQAKPGWDNPYDPVLIFN